ncbi:hypothetical protein N9D63_03135 [Opitutales bacterium]|jgi:hypothetical protein|nr:hypothetical protein [Opitutales bacterium]
MKTSIEKRSQRIRFLVFLSGFLGWTSLATAVDVELFCSDSRLVEGRSVHVLHYAEPVIPNTSTSKLVTDVRATFSAGTSRFRVSPGTYRFDVLFTNKDGAVVALSTGRQELSDAMKLELKTQKSRPIGLTYKGQSLPIVSTQFRVPGTMLMEEVGGPSPEAILSPGAKVTARVTAIKEGQTPVHAVVWCDLDGSTPTVEVTDDWHSVCTFISLCQEKTADARATFFLPEARRGMKGTGNTMAYEKLYEGQNPKELLVVPMEPRVTFITNRRFVELWYEYKNQAGETLRFTRRPVVLSKKHEIEWGGDLRLTAHARVMMTWIKNTRAISWGADLINAAGHRLNLPEDAVGLPGDTTTFPGDTEIAWKQKLLRRDGHNLTLGKPEQKRKKNNYGERTDTDDFQLEEYLLEQQYPEAYKRLKDKDAINGVNADVSDLFKVQVSYKLNGKNVVKEVPCSPWIHYKTTHADFFAPRGMNDVAFSALDRIERTWAYGTAYPKKKQLDRITTRWTGCRWQGYSVGGKHSHVQLGMATLRRRHSLYGADWGPAHEYLHSWGYPHGRQHNQQIARLRRHYRDHHIFLADHPEYEPEPVTFELNNKAITITEIFESSVVPH